MNDETNRMSWARVIAKTIHGLVTVWTIFCGGALVLHLLRIGRMTSTSDVEVQALGTAVGLGFWAVAWFIPVVAGELIAIGLTLSVKHVPEPREVVNREWLAGGILATIPAIVLIGLVARSTTTDRNTPANMDIVRGARTEADRDMARKRIIYNGILLGQSHAALARRYQMSEAAIKSIEEEGKRRRWRLANVEQ